MGKVEAETVGKDKRACLTDVAAQDLPQGRVKKMRRRMVDTGPKAKGSVNLKLHRLSLGHDPREDLATEGDPARIGTISPGDRDDSSRGYKAALIPHLSSPFGIEGRDIGHCPYFLALPHGLHLRFPRGEEKKAGRTLKTLIPLKAHRGRESGGRQGK